MKLNEKTGFAKMITAVAELYGKKISATLLSIYWAALERFTFADIRQAFTQHVNNPEVGQFMPKPADIVRYLEGDAETHALQAWAKVESAIRHVGSYDSVVFDDPIIHVVIYNMGGWKKICATSSQEMSFKINEFIKRYRANLRKPPTEYPKQLTGTFGHVNQLRGYSEDDKRVPVMIGDEQLALRILSEGCSTLALKIQRNNKTATNIIKNDKTAEKMMTSSEKGD